MRWYHAVIIAVGLAVGGLLSGGIYVVHRPDSENTDTMRYNRLTGAMDIYDLEDKAGTVTKSLGWVRLPNGVDHEVTRILERKKAAQPRP